MVTHVGNGVYRVEVDGRAELVYVAGARGRLWAWWNGHLFVDHDEARSGAAAGSAVLAHGAQPLTAPMPGTVLKVLTKAGDHVKSGDTLLILEAMKMELPVRALDAGIVSAVCCREGELVQADSVLVVFEDVP
jgi:3-methylcrotonyl-CoA carboxylase alpha subunit